MMYAIGYWKSSRVVERQHVHALVVRVEEGELVHYPHQVALGDRIAVRPRGEAPVPVAAGRRVVADAHEGEAAVVLDVRLDLRRDGAARKSAEAASLSQRRAAEAEHDEGCQEGGAKAAGSTMKGHCGRDKATVLAEVVRCGAVPHAHPSR